VPTEELRTKRITAKDAYKTYDDQVDNAARYLRLRSEVL